MPSIANRFVRFAAIILIITGGAKIWSALGSAKVLIVSDPLVGMEFRYLLLLVGIIELLVAFICLLSRRDLLRTLLVVWLSTNFLIYRLGLRMIDWHKPCSCLGNLTDALYIPPSIADLVMKIILAYLLIGSYATFFWLWRQNRKAVSATSPEKAISSES